MIGIKNCQYGVTDYTLKDGSTLRLPSYGEVKIKDDLISEELKEAIDTGKAVAVKYSSKGKEKEDKIDDNNE